MFKNVPRYAGQSFLDFVLTWKGDISKMFDILTETKFGSNMEYFNSTIKKYRIDVLNNVITESLPQGGIATDSGVEFIGDFNCDFNTDFNSEPCPDANPTEIFYVYDEEAARLQNVEIVFNGQTKLTDVDGSTFFTGLTFHQNYPYIVTYPTFTPITGSTEGLISHTTTIIIPIEYQCFRIRNSGGTVLYPVEVVFNNQTGYTNDKGEVCFNGLESGSTHNYVATFSGYTTLTGSTIVGNMLELTMLVPGPPPVTFMAYIDGIRNIVDPTSGNTIWGGANDLTEPPYLEGDNVLFQHELEYAQTRILTDINNKIITLNSGFTGSPTSAAMGRLDSVIGTTGHTTTYDGIDSGIAGFYAYRVASDRTATYPVGTYITLCFKDSLYDNVIQKVYEVTYVGGKTYVYAAGGVRNYEGTYTSITPITVS
jgi:hypothetical protein